MPQTENDTFDEDFFLHGASYPDENHKIRPAPCNSCAFINTPESVRPDGVSIERLEEAAADYDDFLCHCLDGNGEAYTCAGWAARFGKGSAEVSRKTVSE
jgi:hypothetical protein